MAAIKLDENLPESIAVLLREAGHDVALVRDEQLAGADDDRVLSVATSRAECSSHSTLILLTSVGILPAPLRV